jgi:hypothetical protein
VLTRDTFVKHFIAGLYAAGETRPIHYEPDIFCVLVGENRTSPEVVLGLSDVFHQCERLPTDRQLAEINRLAKLHHRPKLPDDYGIVEPNLQLSMKHVSYLHLHEEFVNAWSPFIGPSPRRLVHLTLADELISCVGAIHGPTLQLLTQEQIAKWQVSEDEVFRSAKRNQAKSDFRLEPIGAVYRSLEGDSYAASHLVIGEVLAELPLRGAPVVLIPTRDCLVVTGSEDIDGLIQMAAIGHVELEESELAVSGRPLVWDGHAWARFKPPKDASATFTYLEQSYDVATYKTQSTVLRVRYRKATDNTRIAEVRLFPDGPGYKKVALWRSGSPMLLPEADEVALHHQESDSLYVVPWANVQRVLGNRLVPMHFPLRYRAESFPVPAEIEAMEPRVVGVGRPKMQVSRAKQIRVMKR